MFVPVLPQNLAYLSMFLPILPQPGVPAHVSPYIAPESGVPGGPEDEAGGAASAGHQRAVPPALRPQSGRADEDFGPAAEPADAAARRPVHGRHPGAAGDAGESSVSPVYCSRASPT